MIRRLDEEISEWQSFGWQDATSAAGLMDLQKAYPTANNKLFWAILIHHGVPPDGPLINALKGFHCHSECCVKTFLILVLLHSVAPINLQSTWTRKNDGRQVETCVVESTVFSDDTTLHGFDRELHEADQLGPRGMGIH